MLTYGFSFVSLQQRIRIVISSERQVLQRHLPFFTDKNVLFAGGINDAFPLQIECGNVQIWSCYFD